MKYFVTAIMVLISAVWTFSDGQKLDGYYYRDLGQYKAYKMYPTPVGDGYDTYMARNFSNNRSLCVMYSMRIHKDTASENGYCKTEQEVSCGVIDTAGNIIADFKYDLIKYYYSQRTHPYGPNIPVYFVRGDTIGLMDYHGHEIFKAKRTYSNRFCDSIGMGEMENEYYLNLALGMIPRYGDGYGMRPMDDLHADILDECRKEVNQLMPLKGVDWLIFKMEERYGLVNRATGDLVVDPIYDRISMVSNQLAVAHLGTEAILIRLADGSKTVYPKKEVYLNSDTTYFVISHNRKEINYNPDHNQTDVQWVSVFPNDDEPAPAIYIIGEKYGIWEHGKAVIPAEYDDIYFVAADYYWLKKGEKWAVAATRDSFKVLTSFEFLDIDRMNDVYIQNLLYISNIDTSQLDRDATDYGWKYSEDRIKYQRILQENLDFHKQSHRKTFFTSYPGRYDNFLIMYARVDSGYKTMFLSHRDSIYVDVDPEIWDNVFLIPYPSSHRTYQKGDEFFRSGYKCDNLLYNPTSMAVLPVKRNRIYTYRYRGGVRRKSIITGEYFSYKTGRQKWRRAGRYDQKYKPYPPPEIITD